MPADWFDAVPKAELHLHVQGAIPLDALWELIRKYGDTSVPDPSALRKRFVYHDFPHFIQTWVWVRGFMREYDDIRFTTEAFARQLVAQNILYAEAFFSPSDYHKNGLETQKIAEAYRAGLERVPEARVSLVADLVRDFGPEKAAVTLAEVTEVRALGIVGIGIGGSEHLVPPELFRDVYAQARRAGFRTSAHAGEAAGPESVWGAVRELEVDRIGHATRAAEDPELVDHLAERRIPLEMCPVSNLRTGVVASLEEHPVRRFWERGLVVTINTDDPTLFGTTLADEYRLLESRLGFSRDEIRSLILQALESCWLEIDARDALVERFRSDPGWSGSSPAPD
jgi:adenosine deaminase